MYNKIQMGIEGNNNLCRIYTYTVFIRIASCLNTTGSCNLGSLAKILLSELAITSKSNTANEICALLVIITVISTVYG